MTIEEPDFGRQSRGRRDNGLEAAAFKAAGDVDPRVGEHLLDVLGLAGIAAYLQPAADINPLTRANMLPSRPTDRLWVDQGYVARARELINQLDDRTEARTSEAGQSSRTGGEANERSDDSARAADADGPGAKMSKAESDGRLDFDAEWQSIVAGWADEASDPNASIDGETKSKVDESADDRTSGRVRRREQPVEPPRHTPIVGLDVPFAPGEILPTSEEDKWVPPAPPPLPRPTKYAVGAVTLILVGAFLVLFQGKLLPISDTMAMVLGFCGIAGGFGIGVWRLRDNSEDDDMDDGAQV